MYSIKGIERRRRKLETKESEIKQKQKSKGRKENIVHKTSKKINKK